MFAIFQWKEVWEFHVIESTLRFLLIFRLSIWSFPSQDQRVFMIHYHHTWKGQTLTSYSVKRLSWSLCWGCMWSRHNLVCEDLADFLTIVSYVCWYSVCIKWIISMTCVHVKTSSPAIYDWYYLTSLVYKQLDVIIPCHDNSSSSLLHPLLLCAWVYNWWNFYVRANSLCVSEDALSIHLRQMILSFIAHLSSSNCFTGPCRIL